ncbi:MAG: flagellar hook-associated protein FlgK [Gemmatimonadaceae bacterium]|jgi:flagellar hook-associated protein 1 FlgK|nr:flagellar hook-associated protein FlgK [Gemmatimonadaceae bacterium]
MPTGLLGIGRSALMTQQRALQVVSQNIANVETPGYSRQEAVLTANTPVRFPWGNLGTGVSIVDIARRRDQLLDTAFRDNEGRAAGADTRRGLLAGIENIFGEPSDRGMSTALDKFWSAWSDLAANPSSSAARNVVQQRGREVAQLFNNYDRQLTSMRDQAIARVTNTITQVNDLAQQVADLNGRILASEAGGQTAGDLRDARDLAIDKLSTLVGASATPNADGTLTVTIANATLVDNTTARPLTVRFQQPPAPPALVPADLDIELRLGTSLDALPPTGGLVGATMTVINTDIPDMRTRLDAMASAIASEVNTLHRTGYTFPTNVPPGVAAGDFFDPGSVTQPVTAATFKLLKDIDDDASGIAASTNQNGPTDNALALAMAQLKDKPNTVSFGGEQGTFLSFFRSSMTRVGLATSRATEDAEAYKALALQAENRRQEVSGVNLDEELVSMMRFQQAYAAAAKLITTADEMMQTVLTLKQ